MIRILGELTELLSILKLSLLADNKHYIIVTE